MTCEEVKKGQTLSRPQTSLGDIIALWFSRFVILRVRNLLNKLQLKMAISQSYDDISGIKL